MQKAMITVDLAATRRRVARLDRYVEQKLLKDETFKCSHVDTCRLSAKAHHQFREGTMSHVGRRYDLALGGTPLRIVVVGQESGLPTGPDSEFSCKVTLKARHHQVHDLAGLERRYYAGDQRQGRNPHMRGTTTLLRLIMGMGPGTDHEGEFVHPSNGKAFHCFDGFALVNRLLCSTGPVDSSQGTPTPAMFRNCGSHFEATIEILQPTLVVAQGKRVAKAVAGILTPERVINEHLYETAALGSPAFVCTFSHPSAHGALRWGDKPSSTYVEEIVAPTVSQALQALRT